MVYKTPLMIESHIHGAFGVDFNTAKVDEVLLVADKLLKHGIGGFFPTLVTDSFENIKKQISVIKEASNGASFLLCKLFNVVSKTWNLAFKTNW